MSDQIVIQLQGYESTLTYDDWRDFVESRRGKWRGVASDEGVQALREYIESHSGDDESKSDETTETERLKDEIDRLTAENERLMEENERLHTLLGEESTPTPSPQSGVPQTKNDPRSLSKPSGEFDGATSTDSARTDETEKTSVWSWAEYDTDGKATVPKRALERLPDEFDVVDDPLDYIGDELPAVNPEHIEDLPGAADARAATVAAVARHWADVMDEGELVKTAMETLENDTKWYVRGAIVTGDNDTGPETPVMAWLAGRNPDENVEVVTSVDAYETVWEGVQSDRQNEYERMVEKHVGVAMGAAQHFDSFSTLPVTGRKYVETWRKMEQVNRDKLHPLAHSVIEDALVEVCSTGKTDSMFNTTANWDDVLEEWVDDAEGLVSWWETEMHDDSITDTNRREIVKSIEQFVPEEQLSWEEVQERDEDDTGMVEELERIEAAEAD